MAHRAPAKPNAPQGPGLPSGLALFGGLVITLVSMGHVLLAAGVTAFAVAAGGTTLLADWMRENAWTHSDEYRQDRLKRWILSELEPPCKTLGHEYLLDPLECHWCEEKRRVAAWGWPIAETGGDKVIGWSIEIEGMAYWVAAGPGIHDSDPSKPTYTKRKVSLDHDVELRRAGANVVGPVDRWSYQGLAGKYLTSAMDLSQSSHGEEAKEEGLVHSHYGPISAQYHRAKSAAESRRDSFKDAYAERLKAAGDSGEPVLTVDEAKALGCWWDRTWGWVDPEGHSIKVEL